ncbi:TetR/AcrR family transcriptional regulator [Kutzneria sp. CA-103260]|uniref:TetR/AcrR family transcriptional regulator n=1 Tax=Kutzneria sp. CA-103260 TaxID=2802641 RepID=UPI001BAA8336|nr:TetR/AcrR family transcriptional regulator [Kutzneria sp. CA-103260]QUQ64759.1 HTH-type transcriptional regulator BetI [Kutzneria sp. CA-103260]
MADGDGQGLRARKKLQTWRAIRAAALRLIEERGYDAVSIEEIAAAANVSRSTMFNYFPTKEAVVLDPDPGEPEVWRALMRDRPADEPVWSALREVALGYMATFSDRLVVQKRLKQTSPKLAESTREHGEMFRTELSDWIAERSGPGHELDNTLMLHTVQAVMGTAYAMWSPDDGFDRLLEIARACFARASTGFDN